MIVRAYLDQLLADPTDPRVGLGRERAVAFCGDLNDEPTAATTQIVAGPSGSEIDLAPGSAFQRPDADDAFRLWSRPRCCPIGDDPTSRRNQPGSDHAAVVATFTL